MALVDAFLQELAQEAATTRRVLERVPSDKLDWQPHAKSMTLGQLALHVATTPGQIATMIAGASMELPPDFPPKPPTPASTEELLAAFESDLAQAQEVLKGWEDAHAAADWAITKDGNPVMAMPRAGWIRVIGLNHWYHHRGQLSVYLRLLDVPLPSIYGPSADENPFAA
jgi:uncharacterized damage-inducible protein DinB